ncbi:MAG: RecX family transcriptional regulator, partial [Candidatus Omnitrophica bacterium]|nr:RecX family transcriptional regulator [Candidatus Omnitrophota bacterium]
MDNKKTETLQKARAYAFLLLKYRLRSEKELGERLEGKKFDEATVKETLAFLKENDFIDDKVFARAWIDSR